MAPWVHAGSYAGASFISMGAPPSAIVVLCLVSVSKKLNSEWCLWCQTLLYVAVAPLQAFFDWHHFQSVSNQNAGFRSYCSHCVLKGRSLCEDQKSCTNCCIVQLSITSRVTSSMCRYPNWPIGFQLLHYWAVNHPPVWCSAHATSWVTG